MARPRAVLAVLCVVYGVWVLLAFGNLEAGGPAMRLVVDAAAKLVLPLLGLIVLYRVASVRPIDYWVTSPFATRRPADVVALMFISTILLLSYVIVLNLFAVRNLEPVSPHESSPELAGPLAAVAIVYLAASASFSEEIFFRALPRILLGVEAGPAGYLVVSSVLFGVMHAPYGLEAILPFAYFGLVAGLVLLWTNNLWYVLCGHFLADVLIMWWAYSTDKTLPI